MLMGEMKMPIRTEIQNQPPGTTPWLSPAIANHVTEHVSFVEYLRWMRPADDRNPYKDASKVQILQLAEVNADYSKYFQKMNERTRRIAGSEHYFDATCPGRLRVGGIRGPEDMLLPCFDAMGMPYIPGSTLRGIARNQAIRQLMSQNHCSWQDADRQVAPYFGSLEVTDESQQTGKVVFLDAYPHGSSENVNILTMDIANSIWNWDGESGLPKYAPNPNIFLSLKNVEFTIGLRQGSTCSANHFEQEIYPKVYQWLMDGLQSGVGSQINLGNGKFKILSQSSKSALLALKFEVTGQLVHSNQVFKNIKNPYRKDYNKDWKKDRNDKYVSSMEPRDELRSIAIKSMLRYWFRAIALGILDSVTANQIESSLFGSIQPQTQGWLIVRLENPKIKPDIESEDECTLNTQSAQLVIQLSQPATSLASTSQDSIKGLINNLTWLMFHLGGVGQGARRPLHKRTNNPYWRGSRLIPDRKSPFWKEPNTIDEFQTTFQTRLRAFYHHLGIISDIQIDPLRLSTLGTVPLTQCVEALDANCTILICRGQYQGEKPHALAILHSLARENMSKGYNTSLVGSQGECSPIWISSIGNYQVVTIFGKTAEMREKYLVELEAGDHRLVFPLH